MNHDLHADIIHHKQGSAKAKGILIAGMVFVSTNASSRQWVVKRSLRKFGMVIRHLRQMFYATVPLEISFTSFFSSFLS
jgi:hypothetical protein